MKHRKFVTLIFLATTAAWAQTPDPSESDARSYILGGAGVIGSGFLFAKGAVRADEAFLADLRSLRHRKHQRNAALADFTKDVIVAKSDPRYLYGQELLFGQNLVTEMGAANVLPLEKDLAWNKGQRVGDGNKIKSKLESLPSEIANEKRATQEMAAVIDRQLVEIGYPDAKANVEKARARRETAREVLVQGHTKGPLAMQTELDPQTLHMLTWHDAIDAEFKQHQRRVEVIQLKATRLRAGGVLAIAVAGAVAAHNLEKNYPYAETAGQSAKAVPYASPLVRHE